MEARKEPAKAVVCDSCGWRAKGREGHCYLCHETREPYPLVDAIDHQRVMHSDRYQPPDFWPDGTLVYVDETLTPEDFGIDGLS